MDGPGDADLKRLQQQLNLLRAECRALIKAIHEQKKIRTEIVKKSHQPPGNNRDRP